MIRLICANCQGVIDVDLDRSIHSCPYCKSKRLLIKGDKIQFIKIKSPENLKLDEMEQYTYDKQAKMKHEIYIEQERRYNNTAPVTYTPRRVSPFFRFKQIMSSIGSFAFIVIVLFFMYLVLKIN